MGYDGIYKPAAVPFVPSTEDNRRLIAVLSDFNQDVILGADYPTLFGRLLANLLQLTGSEYGFIGERLIDDRGAPYLKTHAITNIAWNDETRAFVAEKAPHGLEFGNLRSLFGEVIARGEMVISNHPATDPRRCGVPAGHPPLDAFLGVPLRLGDRFVGMAGIANRSGGYDEELYRFIGPLVTVTASLVGAVAMERMANFDTLTGLSTRRVFNERFHAECGRHARNGKEFSLLMLDVDHFKAINDRYGHLVGDKCLTRVAAIISDNLRREDVPARFGGEEFVVLLPETPPAAAVMVAEKLRCAVETARLADATGVADLRATVSVGVASYSGGRSAPTLEELLGVADGALYRAKHAGRNRVAG